MQGFQLCLARAVNSIIISSFQVFLVLHVFTQIFMVSFSFFSKSNDLVHFPPGLSQVFPIFSDCPTVFVLVFLVLSPIFPGFQAVCPRYSVHEPLLTWNAREYYLKPFKLYSLIINSFTLKCLLTSSTS